MSICLKSSRHDSPSKWTSAFVVIAFWVVKFKVTGQVNKWIPISRVSRSGNFISRPISRSKNYLGKLQTLVWIEKKEETNSHSLSDMRVRKLYGTVIHILHFNGSFSASSPSSISGDLSSSSCPKRASGTWSSSSWTVSPGLFFLKTSSWSALPSTFSAARPSCGMPLSDPTNIKTLTSSSYLDIHLSTWLAFPFGARGSISPRDKPNCLRNPFSWVSALYRWIGFPFSKLYNRKILSSMTDACPSGLLLFLPYFYKIPRWQRNSPCPPWSLFCPSVNFKG